MDMLNKPVEISDHVWELVLRGMDYRMARRMAQNILDYVCQIRDKDETVLVDWMRILKSQLSYHPLWGNLDKTEEKYK